MIKIRARSRSEAGQHGQNVQVNNGVASRLREIESTPNKLFEADNGERLDTRAPGTASGANQNWKPWERSTAENRERWVGACKVSRNAYRGRHAADAPRVGEAAAEPARTELIRL